MKHVVWCDAKGCQSEAPLTHVPGGHNTLGGGFPFESWRVPETWIEVKNQTFCSWPCIAAHASEQAPK
jgi:hypothetical protein